MSDWNLTTIGEVLTLQRGFDITRAEQRNGSVPVVSSGGISSFNDTAAVRGPGVVIGRKGTLGTVFYLDCEYWPHDTTLWVKDFKGSLPRFVYYFFRYFDVRSLDVGSANPTLNRNHVHPLPVRWPSRLVQERVASVLGALDDKIAVNSQIVRTSDELRSARLSQWMASHPDRLISLPLSSIAQFINGRAFTKDATGSGRMVIRIAELNSGPGFSTVYNEIEVPDDHLARAGDVLFAWSGSLAVSRWFRAEAIINQHIFKVVPTLTPAWLTFELLQRQLPHFAGIAAGKATTMGHIQRHHLDEPVTLPRIDSMGALDTELSPLWLSALGAEQESLTLAELRDTVLPKLMSGEIRVRDAEKIVEDAT